MTEQTIKRQIAREYYNVLYGAKLNFASFDICEKIPTVISVLSLSFGVLGLAFADFNNKVLAALLLIIGIIGIVLKPREAMKDQYFKSGQKLNQLSKQIENLFEEINVNDEDSVVAGRVKLAEFQKQHSEINLPSPVFLSSWYTHYKVFSEHNSDWMCKELNLTWKDKVPLSLRLTLIVLLIALILWIDPYCIASKSWGWIAEPCNGCWREISISSPSAIGDTPAPATIVT